MRIKRRHGLLLAAGLCASALPTVLIAVFGYRQALDRGQEEMAQAASITAHRLDGVLAAADRAIDRYFTEHGIAVTADTPRQLSRLVYLSPYFREAGIVDADDRLVVTSLGLLDEPIPVLEGQRSDPARATLQVVGRLKTAVMREYSILLAKPDPSGGEVNLLAHPDLWTEMLRDIPRGPTGFVAVVGADGQVLASQGRLPGPVIDGPAEDGRVRREASDPARLVRVIVDNDRNWFLRGWYADMRIIVPLYLLGNALLVGFLVHVLRQTHGLGHDLAIAIATHQFVVHYQPIVALDTGRCIGVEALLRWRHPEHGVVLPDVFIPIAEQTGQIDALTHWVLCRVGTELRPVLAHEPQFVVTVNVCPSQLVDGMASRLVKDVVQCGIALPQLVLEITERTLFETSDEGFAAATMRLAEEGVRFAIDDFGTGYSTFSHLVGMRISWMKLDKRMVRGIDQDDRHRLLLDGLIRVGHDLGFRLVAEGVENAAACDYLRARGVDYAQGWVFSPPLPIADLERYLRSPAAQADPRATAAPRSASPVHASRDVP